MTQERMELWSNDSLAEFAIKFNSTIIVNSSNNPDAIVKMTDECPYKEGYARYTLSQWVVYHLANKYAVLIKLKNFCTKSSIFETMMIMKLMLLYTLLSVLRSVKNKPPPKPGLKSHFCNLKYCLEEEREQHEEF